MDELKSALAVVFSRKDVRRMPRKDALMVMSMELRWFSPGMADRVLAAGAGAGLLRVDGDDVVAAFDPASVDVPVDFRPTENIIELAGDRPSGGPPGTFMEMVDEIAAATDSPTREVIARVNGLVLERGFTSDVAALLVGAMDGVDMKRFYGRVAEELRRW